MPKSTNQVIKKIGNKAKILEATVALMKNKGIEDITIRNVCKEAGIATGTFYYYFKGKDDLLFYFVTEDLYSTNLKTDKADITGRIIELYMSMIQHYIDLGLPFMKSFYSTGNSALSAYTNEINGHFARDSILERSEIELIQAYNSGLTKQDANIHLMCKDICTIVKGTVFEWCLSDGNMDIQSVITRIITQYMKNYL